MVADGEQGDHENREGDPRVDEGDRDLRRTLTDKQRAFAEQYVVDPDTPWAAAWRAGYAGGSADEDPPEETSKRRRLSDRAYRLLHHEGVKAYIDELQARAASAFLASPDGAVVREHLAAVEAGAADVEKLAATNLELITRIAHHDPRRVVSWSQEAIVVNDSKELEYHEAVLVKEVRHEDVYHKNGDVSHITTVKLADRAPYVKMLEQRVGKWAPVKVEHSGPGGGAIEHEHRAGAVEAPSDDLIDEIALRALGGIPATRARQDEGLPAADVIRVLEAWELDPNPHCEEPADLFRDEHWEETRARYLVSED